MPTTQTDIANGDIDNTSKTFFSDLLERIEVLEAAPPATPSDQIYPDRIVEHYDAAGKQVIYNKE